MAEFSANALQTVNPGEDVVFNVTEVSCTRGFVRHRQATGNFVLAGWVPSKGGCRCNQASSAIYNVGFGANIAVPTGETVGPISLAITVNGSTVPSSTMIVTPAAVEEFFNVSVDKAVPIWKNCCQTVTIRNISPIPVSVQNANITFSRPDLAVTY